MSEQSNKTIAVTGATGFVGRHVCRELMRRGWGVRALARTSEKARAVLGENPPETVFGDVRDPVALGELMDGACAVVHCVGIRREVLPEVSFRAMHPGATGAVLDAARGARVGRFVYLSALGTRAGAANEYQRSKFAAEQLVQASGLEWTILRPSLIHGADGEFIGMVRDWVLGRAAPRHFIPYFARVDRDADHPLAPPRLSSASVQPVSVDDVARAVGESLERDTSIHEIYPLVGPDVMTWPELLTAVRDALPMTHKDKKTRPIPAPIGIAVAKAAGLVGLSNALPFGASEVVMAAEDSVAPTTKCSDQLGLTPTSFAESLASYADQI